MSVTASAVNYKQTVAEVKAALVARGADLSGAAGAYQIVSRVAWAHRSDGVQPR